MKKRIFIIIAVLLFVSLIIWRIKTVRTVEETVQPSGLSRVKAGMVTSERITEEYKYSATVKSESESHVFPQVPGIVREKVKEPGEYVNKDGAILMIDRNEAALKYSLSAVKSPISGKVLEILVDIGNSVSPATPVAVVGDMSVVKAEVGVSPDDISDIKKGASARIVTSIGKTLYGKVSSVSESVNAQTRKFPVEVKALNKENIKSGIVADIYITVRSVKTDKAVPVTAVTERKGETGIFKIDKDNIAKWTKVKVIAEGDNMAAVEGDLTPEDRVVTDGGYGLIPGRKVQILK